MNDPYSVQDDFLDSLIKKKTNIAIFLVSGIKLSGVVLEQDKYTVKLGGQTQQLIEKSAISTIAPMREGMRVSGPPRHPDRTDRKQKPYAARNERK